MAVYACSDLHGMYGLFQAVQNFLQPDDICYFLGDAADRGPHGIEILFSMMKDKRFIFIKGNHDQFLVDYESEISFDYYSGLGLVNLLSNGGGTTADKFLNLSDRDRSLIANYIRKAPCYLEYKNTKEEIIHLSHAGFSPSERMKWDDELLWDRTHIDDKWTGNNNEYIVHGHSYIKEGPVYCDGHKISLDAASYATGILYLMNLDTKDILTLSS